jgi:hypothetical protein
MNEPLNLSIPVVKVEGLREKKAVLYVFLDFKLNPYDIVQVSDQASVPYYVSTRKKTSQISPMPKIPGDSFMLRTQKMNPIHSSSIYLSGSHVEIRLASLQEKG